MLTFKKFTKLTEGATIPKDTDRCNQCGGSGIKTVAGKDNKTSTRGCDKCDGNGFVPQKQVKEGDCGLKEDTCEKCGGRGAPEGSRTPCTACQGKGRTLKEAVDSKLVAQSTKDLYRNMGEPYEVVEYVFGKAAGNPNAGNAREVQVFLKALAIKVNAALRKKDDLAKHVNAAWKAGEQWGQTGKLPE